MVRNYRGREMECMIDLVENDKADIDMCDTLLVNFIKPSVGTSMEILYGWERGKRVIIVASHDSTNNPWLVYHSHHVYHSVEDAVAYINQTLY